MVEIYSFDQIQELPPALVSRAMHVLENVVVLRAMAGATHEAREAVFRVLSYRGVALLKEDLEQLGPTRAVEIAEAQQKVIDVLHGLQHPMAAPRKLVS